MWDNSVKKIHLAMALDSLSEIEEFPLPQGYGMRFFRPGDEAHWARIELSAGESGDEQSILYKFRRDFSQPQELERRMLFLTENGQPFATATAWFEDAQTGHLHYVAVDAAHQGRGLSKPLVSLALRRMAELGHRRAVLTTQTLSWAAIRLYARFGFHPISRFLQEDEEEGWRIVAQKTNMQFKLEK